MPLPTQEEKDSALEANLKHIDELLGSPITPEVFWWEFILAGVIVVLGVFAALAGGCLLINLFIRLLSWAF